MPNKRITALTQVVTSAIDRVTALMPYVDLTEVLPQNQTKKISIAQLTGEHREEDVILAADILNCGVTPYVVVPAPGVGYYIRVIRIDTFLDFNTTPYATSTQACFKHASSVKPVFAVARILASTVTTSEMGVLQDLVASTDTLLQENEALAFTTANGVNPTAGDSDLKYRVVYAIEPML